VGCKILEGAKRIFVGIGKFEEFEFGNFVDVNRPAGRAQNLGPLSKNSKALNPREIV
jgi:hypothetical protein